MPHFCTSVVKCRTGPAWLWTLTLTPGQGAENPKSQASWDWLSGLPGRAWKEHLVQAQMGLFQIVLKVGRGPLTL